MTDWDLDGQIAEERVRRREKRQEEQARLEGVIRQLAGTKDGAFFLRWIIRETGALMQEFPADERSALWNAGRRSVGMQVFSLCAAVNCADMICAKPTEE